MQDIDDCPSEADSQKDVIPDRKKNTESKAAHILDIWLTNLTLRQSRPNKLYSNLLI